MISIRHCGIYVNDMEKMETFYKNVFRMHYICKQEVCCGEIFDLLTGIKSTRILMTKLITDRGKETGSGDMIELLQAVIPKPADQPAARGLTDAGTVHIAMECEFSSTLPVIEKYGGKIVINPVVMGSGNGMCFIADPEGNYIELIERRRE